MPLSYLFCIVKMVVLNQNKGFKMRKIILLFISSIAFIFGGTSLIEDTDGIVEIHESHRTHDTVKE